MNHATAFLGLPALCICLSTSSDMLHVLLPASASHLKISCNIVVTSSFKWMASDLGRPTSVALAKKSQGSFGMPIVHNSAGKVVVVPTLPKQVYSLSSLYSFSLAIHKNVSTLMFIDPYLPPLHLSLNDSCCFGLCREETCGFRVTVYSIEKVNIPLKVTDQRLLFLPFGNISKIHLWEIVVSTGR